MLKTQLLSLLLMSTVAFSQHAIPFESSSNTIELSVANVSAVAASQVVVNITSFPSWLKFSNLQSQMPNLKLKETGTSAFTFSVDKSAPVNQSREIT